MKIKKIRGWRGLILFLSLTAAALTSCRYLGLKWWQQAELSAFDQFVQKQTPQPPDPRIILVGITEADLTALKSSIPDDLTVAELLRRIRQQQPRAIGLDVVRDLPVPPGTRELEEVFHTTPNLYGVGKFTKVRGDAFFERIDAPPILKAKGQVGDASVQVDFDGILRRGNLFPSTIPSLGLILAAKYLQKEGISDQKDLKGALKLGRVTLPIFEANDGGYVGGDAGGYQILMNWYTSPQSFQQVSLSQVLGGKIAPNLFKDKIVLIGYYTISKKDLFSTPLSNLEAGKTPRQAFGVEIHANLAQYLMKTVLDGYPLLKAIPEPLESLWISSWLCLSGVLIWQFKRVKFSVLLIAAALGLALVLSLVCYEIHFLLFNWGWWLPFFSSTLGILLGSLITLFYVFREKILDHLENLEEKVKERTGELERALATVKLTQKQLIEQEKLAFLGRLTAGFCHQFKNPLYQLKYGFSTIIKSFGGDERELTEEEKAMVIELLKELQEPIEKLELIFKLILISPAQKRVSLLEIKPNDFVNSIIQSVSKYQNKSLEIKINKDFTPELFEKRKIPQQLEIPLFNIIENALDTVFEREKKEARFIPIVQIKTQTTGKSWEIIIEDNGEGIEPEIKAHLFEPFVSTKPETQGIGLGLYISKEVIERIGGQIVVNSSQGQGSKFILKIPVFD